MKEILIKTHERNEMLDITSQIQLLVEEQKIRQGLCFLYVPHTTAGMIINEKADPNVAVDILGMLKQLIPLSSQFRHREGNSDAHIKALMTGSSETVIIENGKLQLGTWQGIFLCKFDGPRHRKVWVQFIDAK